MFFAQRPDAWGNNGKLGRGFFGVFLSLETVDLAIVDTPRSALARVERRRRKP